MAARSLDPLFVAQSLLMRRKHSQCIELCDQLLDKNPLDKAAWFIKTRALTSEVATDECELEPEGLAELALDEAGTADIARPGTSFKRPLTNSGPSQSVRPMSKSGRPLTGFTRPGTSARPTTTMEGAVNAPRTAASRPVTSASGRYTRLGTASLVVGDAGVFIDAGRLDMRRYAARPTLSRALFLYLLHVANDVAKAVELAALASEHHQFKSWWWKTMLGFGYYRLNMMRDAEAQFKSAIRDRPMIVTFHLLAKVYVRLDQPKNAAGAYTHGLQVFMQDTTLMAGLARIYEGIGDHAAAMLNFKRVISYESTNAEAIASLATDHFYSGRPETALLLFRRLLQMGAASCELFNNMALCCFHSQQYDMALALFQRALRLADDDGVTADIWYNQATVAVALGDISLAYQCFKLAVISDPTHAEAFANLGVLEHRKGDLDQADANYQAAIQHGPQMYEPHYNRALIFQNRGQLQHCFESASKAAAAYPQHTASVQMVAELSRQFSLM